MARLRGVWRTRPFRIVAGALAAAALLLALGYAFLLRHVEPEVAREAAERELASYALEPGEVVQRKAYVRRRSAWDYFRSTHGLLAATNRRLIALTVSPTDRLATEIEFTPVDRREFPLDTLLQVRKTRVPPLLARGVVIRSGPQRLRLAAGEGEWPRLEALAEQVYERQEGIRASVAAERASRLAALAEAQDPIAHVVQRGDALSSIAQTYGTTEERLQLLNGLAGPGIRAGDTLLVKPRG